MESIEQIIKRLQSGYYGTSSNLSITYSEDLPNGKAGLNRDIFVEAENGEKFIIEWWKNLLYIKYNRARIPCDKIVVSSTFPMNSRLNIQAEYKGDTIFILPIRDY